jgi:hypothetical protein
MATFKYWKWSMTDEQCMMNSVIKVYTLPNGLRSWRISLKLAFVDNRSEVKCLCNRYWNIRMLFEYEMSDDIAKQEFMSDYLVWH